MNYSELSQLAISQPWAAKYKDDQDTKNVAILEARQKQLDSREGIGVGDIVLDGDKEFQVAHNWGDAVQLTDGRFGSSFYLGDGYVEFSGGLNPSIPVDRFIKTERRLLASVWFFSCDNVEAHNGYHTKALFKVWRKE